jgi:hypothetical protein
MAAKAPTVPAKASACVGFKREKRDDEEQHRDSANTDPRCRSSTPTPIPPLDELSRRRLHGRSRLNLGISPRTQSFQA